MGLLYHVDQRCGNVLRLTFNQNSAFSVFLLEMTIRTLPSQPNR